MYFNLFTNGQIAFIESELYYIFVMSQHSLEACSPILAGSISAGTILADSLFISTAKGCIWFQFAIFWKIFAWIWPCSIIMAFWFVFQTAIWIVHVLVYGSREPSLSSAVEQAWPFNNSTFPLWRSVAARRISCAFTSSFSSIDLSNNGS